MRAGLAASCLVAGCFLDHPPGPADAGAPGDGSVSRCEPAPAVRIDEARWGGDCRCPPDEIISRLGWELDQDFLICSGLRENDPIYGCRGGIMCAAGFVCDDVTPYPGGGCTSGPACVYYRQLLGDQPPTTCVYADLTTADSGRIPEIDCTEDVRSAGLCGAGCDCREEGLICYGPSETHPVGVCVREQRQWASSCDPAGASTSWCDGVTDPVCATPAIDPAWADEVGWAEVSRRYGFALFSGVCVERHSCEALAARHPDAWRCLEIPPSGL